jgi:hypothetical protein
MPQSAGYGEPAGIEALTRGLNERGVRSARGGRWHVSSVTNLLTRTQKLAEARLARESL